MSLKNRDNSPLLLETIKIKDGTIYNLDYHQERCDNSRMSLFNTQNSLILKEYIDPPQKGLFRCRVLYTKKSIESVSYLPYKKKEINTLKIVSTSINYPFKYADREEFNKLLATHSNYDDVIIEKHGYLTDTTIANIAFFNGSQWFTPKKPLLQGTMRAQLLKNGIIRTKDIRMEDLNQYSQVALINAMIGFKIINHFTIDAY